MASNLPRFLDISPRLTSGARGTGLRQSGMRWSPFTSRLLALAAAAGTRVGNVVFPPSCVFCGMRQQRHVPVCSGCHGDLPWIAGDQEPVVPLQTVAAPLEYAYPVDAAIKAMKFKRKLFYAPAFAQLLLQTFPDLPDDIDALLPMPLHWFRHASRGFNQATEIAMPVQRATGLPLVRNVIRQRGTPFQSGLSAAQRRRNLAAAFRARGSVSYRHVLIVDDVVTTGESCRQLARVVLAAGAEKVSAIAVARVLL